jgi:hypothetical protein
MGLLNLKSLKLSSCSLQNFCLSVTGIFFHFFRTFSCAVPGATILMSQNLWPLIWSRLNFNAVHMLETLTVTSAAFFQLLGLRFSLITPVSLIFFNISAFMWLCVFSLEFISTIFIIHQWTTCVYSEEFIRTAQIPANIFEQL